MRFLLFLLVLASAHLALSQRFSGLTPEDENILNALPLLAWQPEQRTAGAVSLKPYAPYAQHQGEYANCVGWAVAYAARTIVEARSRGLTDRQAITARAFSPGFTYRLAIRNASCEDGASLLDALNAMERYGAVLLKAAPEPCPGSLSKDLLQRAARYRTTGYDLLFYGHQPAHEKVGRVKAALAAGRPVVMGMNCPASFEKADGKSLWLPAETPGRSPVYGHALCIVGYDDQRHGGAFELMNSWGEQWGDKGFIWVKYAHFVQFAKYALAMKEPAALRQ